MVVLLVAALAGMVFGAICNAAIPRLGPMARSAPRLFRCPDCAGPLPWRVRVGLVAWLARRCSCPGCGSEIPSRRRALVEAFCALLAVSWSVLALGGFWPDAGQAGSWLLFAAAGIPLALVDWDTFEIPDGLVVVAGAGGGLLRCVLSPDPWNDCLPILRDGVLAAGFLYALSFSSRVCLGWLGSCARAGLRCTRTWQGRRKARSALKLLLRWSRFDADVEALGLGDVSLGLAAGAALGFQPVLVGLPVAALLGILGHLAVAGFEDRARDAGLDAQSIPFGPFLVGGFLVAALALNSAR